MTEIVNVENVQQYVQGYAQGIRDHEYPNENLVRLARWFLPGDGGKLLDYGFGPGANLIFLLKCGYICTGVEITPAAKELVEGKLKEFPEFAGKFDLHVLGGNANRLPFEDNTFDHIVSNQVVYLLASEEKILHLLAEFKRVLKPNGKLIITMMSRLNEMCINGSLVEPNVYKYELKDSGYTRNVYILRDQAHAQRLFNVFNVHEVGWFDNYYGGVSGHHYVILATND